MFRQVPSLHLVGDPDSPRAAAVLAAGHAVGLAGVVRVSSGLSTARTAAECVEVLILLEANAEDLSAAIATCDERGLPRWAVVPSSFEEAQAAEFASSIWEFRTVTRAIISAVALLDLRRENSRLRGDLCTMGRRLTHDLRMPLNSISTANEALGDRTIARASGADLHRSVSDSVQHAAGLIERVGNVFLATARPIDIRLVDMEEPLWNARQKLETLFRLSRATIRSAEKWPSVQGVPSLLEVVWSNLLSNSVQHGGPEPRIEVGWKRAGSRTCFFIHDSGPGVPVAQRSRLFHPLDRLHELNAPRGYGLPIVHRAIELHHGMVGYDPDPQPGGTFFFTLP